MYNRGDTGRFGQCRDSSHDRLRVGQSVAMLKSRPQQTETRGERGEEEEQCENGDGDGERVDRCSCQRHDHDSWRR
jgi:hypothetical protein